MTYLPDSTGQTKLPPSHTPSATTHSYMMAGDLGAGIKDPMLYGAYVRGDDNLKRD